jgi:histone H3/H4
MDKPLSSMGSTTPDFECKTTRAPPRPAKMDTFKRNGRERTPMANLTVKAAVKDELSEMNISSDFYDALDEEVSELLDDAERRAQDNDRKTVQPRDL